MKKLIIFDCDGTLVDSEVIACRVFRDYWATHGVVFTEDEFKENFIGTGSDAAIVKNTFSKMPDYVDKEGNKLLDEALDKELLPVTGMLDLLKTLDADMCVASNSSLKYVKSALKKTKLEKYFGDKVFSAEQVNNPKPSPDLFEYVCSELGYNVQDCIVIEDSTSGIRAAQNAKIKVVAFCGAAHFTPFLVSKLEELKPNYLCRNSFDLASLLKTFSNSKIDHGKYSTFDPAGKKNKKIKFIIRDIGESDIESVAHIVWERDEKENTLSSYIERITNEFKNSDRDNWKMVVAESDGKILGYGRLVKVEHRDDWAFSSPSGWYLMGVAVSHDYRRMGIAKAITEYRLNILSKITDQVFYICNARNKSSIVLHDSFRFKKVSDAKGYMNILFDGGVGHLFNAVL
jgi:HAD superfamily hydrolase (TIGR01509 family)